MSAIPQAADVYRFPGEGPEGDTAPTVEDRLFDALGSEFDDEGTPTDDEPVTPVEEDEEEEAEDQSEDATEDEEDGESDEDEDDAEEEIEESGDDTALVIDGEQTTLGDLKKDRLRQADYTRKTQDLAEARKAFESEQAETSELREQYATNLESVEQFLASTVQTEPDWDKLRQENPAEFAAQYVEYKQRTEQLAAVKAEREKVAADSAKMQESARATLLKEEAEKLVEAIPEWKDEKVALAEKAGMRDYAHSLGFTDEQLSNVLDHRVLVLLRDAVRYHEGVKSQNKVKEQVKEKVKTTKVLPAGAKRDNTVKKSRSQKRLQTARNRLAKSGSMQDAAAAIYELLDD